MTTQATVYISAADTAKEVRRSLKAMFPAVKFSVRTSTYSGGASIRVSWTDGPIAKRVESITKVFTGASFDGMIDLKSYHNTEYQGQAVHFGADYVFCERSHSLALLKRAVTQVANDYGTLEPRIITPDNYEPYLDNSDPVTTSYPGGGAQTFDTLVWRALQGMEG